MSERRIKREAASDYDVQNDSFFAYSKDVKYKSSIDIDGIILDIGEDNSIMGIEILDASKKFGISKYDVQHYKKLNVQMDISPKVIDLKMTMRVGKRNAEVLREAAASALNIMNLPVGSDSLAVGM
ncbi:DUF2283 domain-containing protein [Methanolobus psychrotolerans]|uniref:DUF2283 domain-containing protein n=1 Tax=Methanolobus psychrotolerans TaxID=1874706 RepID=UPI000B916D5A|nr:DUF2283 domain-containing protein [Methanolobus psychrotolerans]